MRNFIIILFVLLVFLYACNKKPNQVKYKPTFESLEQVDTAPEWFKDAKFGIYFHWGVYSVPAYSNYKMIIYAATLSELSMLHVEFNGLDKSGLLNMPNTGAYQNWETTSTIVKLEAGKQLMKIYIDEASLALNLDKIVFKLK